MQVFSEAATAVSGGNPVLSTFFWSVVAFVFYALFSGKWKALFASGGASNLLSLIVEQFKGASGKDLPDGVQELLKLLKNFAGVSEIAPEAVVTSTFVQQAFKYTEGIPEAIRAEMIVEASKTPNDLQGLLVKVNAYLINHRKGEQVS